MLPFVIAFVHLLIYRPLVAGLGLPPLYGSVLLWITTIVVELGYLLYLGKVQAIRLTLKGIVLYRQPLPWWQYIDFVVLFLALSSCLNRSHISPGGRRKST
ncbi:hypothetical protein ACFLV7_06250 [Chloroflexota bacterium]